MTRKKMCSTRDRHRGLCREVVVSTIVAPGPSKAVCKDAVLKIFAKGLADTGLWRVVVALAVELACADKFMPSREMVG